MDKKGQPPQSFAFGGASMPTRDKFKFSVRKLEELVLVIVQKASDIGVTKLEKLLYLCDFISAERTGFPITGETYRHFDRGPVPKHIVPILGQMEKHQLSKEVIPLKSGKFVKFKVKHGPDQTAFSQAEKKIITEVLAQFGGMSSQELVAYVHNDLTYKATKRNEDIPYSLAAYRRYTKPDRAAAEALKDDPDYMRVLNAALA
jgi:uncharacterized phage-associated protein